MDPLTPFGGKLTAYLHEPDGKYIQRGTRPGILVIPGGGYGKIVDREEDPVAFQFFAAGFHTFILEYRVREHPDQPPLGKTPLLQAASAICIIRQHQQQWNLSGLAVLGFSAGGHLAGSCAVHWDDPELSQLLGVSGETLRPDAAVLCYPAALTGCGCHSGSIVNLAGDGDRSYYDLPSHVTERTPPVFIWATVEDQLVPVENTLELMLALHRKGVSCESHIYAWGLHGLTLASPETGGNDPHIASWVPLCKYWLGRQLGFQADLL